MESGVPGSFLLLLTFSQEYLLWQGSAGELLSGSMFYKFLNSHVSGRLNASPASKREFAF